MRVCVCVNVCDCIINVMPKSDLFDLIFIGKNQENKNRIFLFPYSTVLTCQQCKFCSPELSDEWRGKRRGVCWGFCKCKNRSQNGKPTVTETTGKRKDTNKLLYRYGEQAL